MKILHLLSILALAVTVPFVAAKDEEQDDDGFFNFQDNMDWSNSAILPLSCVETNQGEHVAFTLYKKNHNSCRKNAMGTYKTTIPYFLRSYIKQMKKEYEAKGADYEVEEDTLEFLECQQYYYNNQMYYMKIGCRSTGSGFQVHAYSDMYCTQKVQLGGYNNMGVDISSLKVNFQTCKACVAQNGYNQYNNNNNAYYNNYGGGTSSHDSYLCAATYHYKENCNRACRRAAKNGSSGSSSRTSYSGDGFSTVGKVFLWILSFSAIFFLLAGLAQRKKMSKQDTLIEEAAIKSSGVDKKYIPRIFIGFALFIIILIIFKKKVLTWFFLVAINIALFGYWMHLKNKAEQNAAVSGFQLYGEGGTPA